MKAYEYLVGVDLGQSADYTADVVLRRGKGSEPVYDVPHIERLKLGLSYPDITAHIVKLATKVAKKGSTALVVDATGVGKPVVDDLRNRLPEGTGPVLYAVTITGGDSVSRKGRHFRVPKRDLISAAIVLSEQQRLAVSARSPFYQTLKRELQAFSYKIKASGHEAMEGAGEHDDLVLALALPCWLAIRAPADPNALAPRPYTKPNTEDMEAHMADPLRDIRPRADVPQEHIDRAKRETERTMRKHRRAVERETRTAYNAFLANMERLKSRG